MHRHHRLDECNAEAEAKGKKGSGKAIGRSTMDDGLLKIIDFEGKLMIRGWKFEILADNGCLGMLLEALGAAMGDEMATGVSQFGAIGLLW